MDELKKTAWDHLLVANDNFDGEKESIRWARDRFDEHWRKDGPCVALLYMDFPSGSAQVVATATFPSFREAWAWIDDQWAVNARFQRGAVYPTSSRKQSKDTS
jgi:hypothetical protein